MSPQLARQPCQKIDARCPQGGKVVETDCKDTHAASTSIKMPFAVQFRMGADSWEDHLEGYEDCDTPLEVLQRLLAEWVSGDADMYGTFTFLAAHGHVFEIMDDDVDEGTDEDLLARAGELVLGLCVDNDAVTQEYLTAIGDRVRLVELERLEGDSETDEE